MSLLSNSVRLLASTVKQVGGEWGKYGRGITDVEIIATQDQSQAAGGLVEDVAVLDTDSVWIFTRKDLVLDGRAIKPRPGDIWTWIKEDGTQEVFRVLPPTQEERCWEPMDPEGLMIRVSMKHRETIVP